MALSNWDTLALDENSQPTNGVFISPLGIVVEIYKNWLYVRDTKAWEEGAFIEPTIMEIQQGVLRYKDVEIEAVRGPKNGVYCVVWSQQFPSVEEDCACGSSKGGIFHHAKCSKFVDTTWSIMVGMGIYGYDGSEWVGVKQPELDFLRTWLDSKEEEVIEINGKDRKFEYFDFDDRIRAIDLTKALRFNQGDMFFANNIGVDPQATPPAEEAPPPHINAFIEGMKRDE